MTEALRNARGARQSFRAVLLLGTVQQICTVLSADEPRGNVPDLPTALLTNQQVPFKGTERISGLALLKGLERCSTDRVDLSAIKKCDRAIMRPSLVQHSGLRTCPPAAATSRQYGFIPDSTGPAAQPEVASGRFGGQLHAGKLCDGLFDWLVGQGVLD